MFERVGDIDAQSLIIYLIIGLLICAVAIFIIKNVSNYVVVKGKIIDIKCLIFLLVAEILFVFNKEIHTYFKNNMDINISSKILIIISILIAILVILYLIIKMGLVKGISMFVVQFVASILFVSTIYAGAVLIATGIAIMIGVIEIIVDKYPIKLISIDLDEIVFVKTMNDFFMDQYGQVYVSYGKQVLRTDDNKWFVASR